MARKRSLSKSSLSSSKSDSEAGTSSNRHSDSEPDDDSNADNESESEPEPPPSQRRKDLRWLHAGLFKDARGVSKDIWYAFKKNRRGQYQIIYASDWEGTSFDNKNVGRRKSDLITWDKHHSDKWSQYITAKGTWEYKRAMIGRAVQRNTLLRTWLNPNSPDIYAHGKDRNRTLGAPLNVIHAVNDRSPGGIAPGATRVPFHLGQREVEPEPADCYPDTRISYSTIKIIAGVFKDRHDDPHMVIADFLTGQIACHPKFKAHRTDHNDQIESAFYECGWRINRRALERANDDMAMGKIENAFQSKSWNLNPPLRVDKFKGDRLDLLLQQMRDDMREQRDADESLNDDDSPEPSTPTFESAPGSESEGTHNDEIDLIIPGIAGPSKRNAGRGNYSKGKLRQAPPRRAAKKSATSGCRINSAKKAWQRIVSQQDLSDDEFEYLPDDSIHKGKGLAMKKAVNKINNRVADKAISTRKSLNSPKKRIAKSTSDEDEEDGEEKVIRDSTLNPVPTKKVKTEVKEHSVICIDQSDDGGSDSDVQILEDISTPVAGVKAEISPKYYDEENLPDLP
ncbi:hypothetical protein BKA65DRAFT_581810 [Rhexocercosporidium sp. MPI-PUGE-AT-0058]|nr:hypothetical protein BKA65DRAFT_581810 [Rhexocercosporidium sp. MPI-PUGE-AT-0058]